MSLRTSYALFRTALCALAACGSGAPPSEPPDPPPNTEAVARSTGAAAQVAATEAALGDDELVAPAVWPASPQPIADDLARAETEAACAVRIQTSLSTDVAESIAGLGYDRFVADLCGGLAAVRGGDVAACDALSVSSARAGCRRRLALVHARPDACPSDPSVRGREPVCLAWAARDVGLCRGAALGERARCEAVLSGEPARCRTLPAEPRARCLAELARYGAALGRTRTRSAARDVEMQLALTLTVTPSRAMRDAPDASYEPPAPDASSEPPAPIAISKPSLERGIVIARCSDGLRAYVGDASRHGAPLRLDGPAEAELLLRWPTDAGAGPLRISAAAHDAALRLRLAHASDTTNEAGGGGAVTLDAHDATRGALLSGSVELTLSLPAGRGRVTGTFRTFVRDLLDADSEECAR